MAVAIVAGFVSNPALADFDSGIINFDYQHPSDGSFGPGAAVIGAAGDVWNSTLGTSLAALMRTDGSVTTVNWNLTSTGSGTTVYGGTFARLGDTFNAFSDASITGLTPNLQYELYLFFRCTLENQVGVEGTTFSTPGIPSGSTINTLVLGTHYDFHVVTANASGVLTFTPLIPGATVDSWQLRPVAIPEPGVVSLAVIGLAVLAGSRLARRK